jgi:hypothetical protein
LAANRRAPSGTRSPSARRYDEYAWYLIALTLGDETSESDLEAFETAELVSDEDRLLALAFDRAPTVAAVDYELALGDGAAGLRLVADSLEILDGRGAPRLRVAPPYLVGEDGRRRRLRCR